MCTATSGSTSESASFDISVQGTVQFTCKKWATLLYCTYNVIIKCVHVHYLCTCTCMYVHFLLLLLLRCNLLLLIIQCWFSQGNNSICVSIMTLSHLSQVMNCVHCVPVHGVILL